MTNFNNSYYQKQKDGDKMNSVDVSESVRKAFNFSVDKFPLFGPDNMKTDQYGLFRSDTGYIEGVKSISSRYVPHTTDDVCALVDAASTLFDGKVSCQMHWDRGHYVSISPTQEQRQAVYGTKDNIFPRVVIRGGFDGKGFHGTMGFFRDACRNMAMLRTVQKCNISIRHTSGLRDRMQHLIDQFHILSEGWQHLVESAREMEKKTVRLEEFIHLAYESKMPTDEERDLHKVKTQSKVTRWEKRVDSIRQRVMQERVRTGRPGMNGRPFSQWEVSGWEAYNAIQGYVQHDAQGKASHSSDFARILRASNDPHVVKAEQLVMALAS